MRPESDPVFASIHDFGIPDLLQRLPKNEENHLPQKPTFANRLSTETEAVIFTTSGTSGKSKLIAYNQGAFSINCQSWQMAGLYDDMDRFCMALDEFCSL